LVLFTRKVFRKLQFFQTAAANTIINNLKHYANEIRKTVYDIFHVSLNFTLKTVNGLMTTWKK